MDVNPAPSSFSIRDPGSAFHRNPGSPRRESRSACLLHFSGDLVAFLHESLICGTLLQTAHVPLKNGARFESFHHHPEGNLRTDVDVGSTELRTEYVGASRENLSQSGAVSAIAAVTQRTWPGGCRARQHAVYHRGLDAIPTEEQPPVVSSAQRALSGGGKARGRKGIREVRANGSALGHDRPAVYDRWNLSHRVDGQEIWLLLLLCLEVHDLEPVGHSHFLQHPVHDASAGHRAAIKDQFFAHRYVPLW